jgi:hypothetical protein
MRFPLRAGQMLLGAVVAGAATPSCFAAGTGTAPPTDGFYFPVGLAVSPDGRALYVVNSDFDLQYNGGTLQSYDLGKIRTDTVSLISANLGATPSPASVPFIDPTAWRPGCTGSPPAGGVPLGQECTPPVDSTKYWKQTAVVGAFATDLQVSVGRTMVGGTMPTPIGYRLFIPVRGDAALTWADIDPNDPLKIDCGQGADKRCGADHRAGSDPDQLGDTRHVAMPGEPFGMAQSEDGTAIAITHQSDTKTSLLASGLCPPAPCPDSTPRCTAPACSGPAPPSMKFVLDGLPTGGIGIAAIPHDPYAPVPPCERTQNALPCVRPAFLETSRSNAAIDLIRYYDDDGSSLHRPFLQSEAAYPITANAIGIDSRGIVIDRTSRISCKAQGLAAASCAMLSARVFFASRTPPALGLGEIGGPPATGQTYDPDRLVLTRNVPLPSGPSNVYLAPIIDATGHFALRVFIVLFDSNQIAIYDPEAPPGQDLAYVDHVNVGPGPFAMTFDPFTVEQVGSHALAAMDANGQKTYRFAYVASFTQSFIQVIDLDNSQRTAETFERVVFTLGKPTQPKGR